MRRGLELPARQLPAIKQLALPMHVGQIKTPMDRCTKGLSFGCMSGCEIHVVDCCTVKAERVVKYAKRLKASSTSVVSREVVHSIDLVGFKSANCLVGGIVSQPRGAGYGAHRINAAELTERHGRAIRDLANSYMEVDISNCCNSCARMAHTHAPKFSDMGDLEIELGRCNCPPSGIGAANDAKGPLHAGLPPGCMSGGCVKSEALDGAKHNLPLVSGDLQFAPLSSLVHAAEVSVSANVAKCGRWSRSRLAVQSKPRNLGSIAWGSRCLGISIAIAVFSAACKLCSMVNAVLHGPLGISKVASISVACNLCSMVSTTMHGPLVMPEDKDSSCGAGDRVAVTNVHNKCSSNIRHEDVEGCLRGDICSNARCPSAGSSGLCQDTSAPVMQLAAGGTGIRSRDEQAQTQGSNTRTQQGLRVDSRSIDNKIKVESSNTSRRLFGLSAVRSRCEGGALGVHRRSDNQI